MDILIIGGGGREHAIAWKLRQSRNAGKIYCAPGNAGTFGIENCENVGIAANDIYALLKFAKENNIGFTVVGPEEPLVLGVADLFMSEGLRVFGPVKAAAQLEGSKAFSKNLMKKYNIPTASYELFSEVQEAAEYIKKLNDSGITKKPIVIKADGLALGKGVVICETKEDALKALDEILVDKKFGASGNTVVIEEYLPGKEVSILAFCDGKTIKPMIPARDHKRALDGDMGLNTGGMGAVTGVSDYTDEIAKECMDEIFAPTVNALISEGIEYKGIIFFGLMLTDGGAKVIEYNARFGDPETQAVLPMLENDLLDILLSCADGTLDEVNVSFRKGSSACVVAASGGYPESYRKGFPICGLKETSGKENTIIFHLGTKRDGEKILTDGGRVICVTGLGKDASEAIKTAYEGIDGISFEAIHYRKDIGKSILMRNV